MLVVLAGALWTSIPVTEASATVHIRVEGSSTTLFDGLVSVGDCTVTDTTGVAHALSTMAACALVEAADQAGFTYEFQDFGFGLFLKKIGDDDTPADFSKSWGFFVAYDPASVGADTYQISGGEDLLFAFSGYPGVPLRVTLPASVHVGTESVFVVEKRVGDFDASFNWSGRWENAAGATLQLGDEALTVPDDGQVSKTFTTSDSLEIYATGDSFIRSARTTVAVQAAPSPTPSPSPVASPSPTPTLAASPSPQITPTPSPTPVASPTPTPTPTRTPSPTPTGTVAGSSTTDRKQAALRALQYLRNQQDTAGGIDGQSTSAWSAIAFGANSQPAHTISRGGSSLLEALAQASLTSATDVERQILAVRASGHNPAIFYGQNLVAKLKTYYHDNQIGETALVNDDIFGVLALLGAGESATSQAVERTVETILAKQSSNGSWVSVDMTAAAIQALRAYRQRDGKVGVDDAVVRARGYLKLNQDEYGGFSENSASTAWAIQAIISLGENPDDWKTGSGATPWNALPRYQNDNGGFGWQSTSDVSSFMTSYAATALLGAPWPVTNVAVTMTPVTIATGGESSPMPTPTVRVARVAGVASSTPASFLASTVAGTTNPAASYYAEAQSDAESAALASQTELEESSSLLLDSAVAASPIVPVTATDRNFAIGIFGLANLGVGVTVARLFAKLNFF